jgi:hypothetical protein
MSDSEEGQVKYNMAETTTNDTKCRCDYTRGYAFVEKPRNTCYCIPSPEFFLELHTLFMFHDILTNDIINIHS